MNSRTRLAFELYATGITVICASLLLPIVLLVWNIFGALPVEDDLNWFCLYWTLMSIVVGILVTTGLLLSVDTVFEKKLLLLTMLEEGRLMCIYGNIIGIWVLLFCIGRRVWKNVFPATVVLAGLVRASAFPNENRD